MEIFQMEKIGMTIVAVSGAVIALRWEGLFHKVISFGLALSILLTLTGNAYLITGSFIAAIVLAFATAVYGFRNKKITNPERVSLIVTGLFLAVRFIFQFQNWPNVVDIFMIVPIGIMLVSFIKNPRITREMSFMIIWFAYLVMQFTGMWIKPS